MQERPQIPRFGVPRRIRFNTAIFVVVAGIPLAIVYMGVLGNILSQFEMELDGNNGVLVFGALGLGPASAYYFKRWLRARRVSPLLGCGMLVLWVVALVVGALVGGWLAVAGLGILSALALWRWVPNRC